MSLSRLGTIIRLELLQRVRSVAWYVLLGVFALVLLVVTVLAAAASALTPDGARWLFSLLILLVLLLALLVSPTLSGSSVNGDREAAVLAPLQVTRATTREIILGKFLAAWIAGLAFLVVALPFLVIATIAGDLRPATIATSLVILVIEVGVVAAIGVGLSAIVARPLFSVASTYLVVAALTLGTLIAFGLGTLTAQVEVTVTQRDVAYSQVPLCGPGQDPEADGCVTSLPDEECGPWQTSTYTTPRTDHVWWILAANPFVVLADATPSSFTNGYPNDLFGQIAYGVRMAQLPPQTEVRQDFCASMAWTASPTPEEQLRDRATMSSWFVGLLVQAVLAAGLLVWGGQRTRTPARRLPPGTRIA